MGNVKNYYYYYNYTKHKDMEAQYALVVLYIYYVVSLHLNGSVLVPMNHTYSTAASEHIKGT